MHDLTDVKGYEGLYAITRQGRIWSYHYPRTNNGGWLHYNPSYGYPKVRLGKKRHFVHRLVAETFIPNPNGLPEVNHIDCNRKNACVKNLEWVTHRGNAQHMVRLGRARGARGESNFRAKLTSDKVQTIRELGKQGIPHRELAKRYHIHRSTVAGILSRRIWKHLPIYSTSV